MRKSIFIVLIFFTYIIPVNSQQLKRKYLNGFQYNYLTNEIKNEKGFNGEYGFIIEAVLPNSTSESAGIKKGDIIVEVNNVALSSNDIFSSSPLSNIREGETVEYKVWRNKQYLTLNTIAKGKAKETKDGIKYEYGEIKTSFGYLRTITSKPINTSKKLPAVLFIQGNICESIIDISEKDPYRQFCDQMTLQGYAVMRIDKPGSGESEGKYITCDKMSFTQEIEQFQTGIDYLKNNKTIDSKKIYLFGHSMGGVITPILASQNKDIKGTIVYGTLTSTYGNYLPEIVYRSVIQNGNTEEDAEQYKNYIREITTALFEENKSPQQIISKTPEYESLLQQVLGWNEKNNTILYRSLTFNGELNKINPKEYWEKINCPILSIFGTSDFEAIDKDYATKMIDWGNTKFQKISKAIILQDTDHAFAKVGSMEEGRRLKYTENYKQIMENNFNPLVVTKTIEWLKSL